MKTGIITFHDTTNFGSLLQTYGLYRAIQKLGYECEVIDYQCESICNRELPKPLPLKSGIKSIIRHILFDEKRIKYRELHRFLVTHMNLGVRCNLADKHKVNTIYDKFIVGSDIVWGLDVTNQDTTYFLDFVDDNTKKYSFSSSIGNAWTDQEKNILKPYLASFQLVSVREDEAADWVEEVTGIRPKVVCDPTMLLESEDWKSFVSKKYSGDSYVLVYFDSPQNECLKSAIEYGKANGIKVYFINYGRPVKGTVTVRPYCLEDFMSLLYNAQRIFTASYHGMLFSIYFNRQFLYYNRSHKSRMNTIAKRFDLEQYDGSRADINNLKDIDYRKVNEVVELYRNSSLLILQKILSQ